MTGPCDILIAEAVREEQEGQADIIRVAVSVAVSETKERCAKKAEAFDNGGLLGAIAKAIAFSIRTG